LGRLKFDDSNDQYQAANSTLQLRFCRLPGLEPITNHLQLLPTVNFSDLAVNQRIGISFETPAWSDHI